MSLLVHGGAVGGVVYAQSLKPPRIDVTQSIPVELVQLGKERDRRLLPRLAPPPPPPPPPEPVAPPPPVEPAEPPPPAADAVALDTEKPKEKPEKKKPPRKRKARLSKAAQRLLNNGANNRLDRALERLEDRTGSPDGSPSGRSTDPNRAAEGYQRAVAATLKNAYEIPAPIPRRSAPVSEGDRRPVHRPQRAGSRSSTSPSVTEINYSCRRSKSCSRPSPFPSPPASCGDRWRTEGVVVIFDP